VGAEAKKPKELEKQSLFINEISKGLAKGERGMFSEGATGRRTPRSFIVKALRRLQ